MKNLLSLFLAGSILFSSMSYADNKPHDPTIDICMLAIAIMIISLNYLNKELDKRQKNSHAPKPISQKQHILHSNN
jgi:hypothetical protein